MDETPQQTCMLAYNTTVIKKPHPESNHIVDFPMGLVYTDHFGRGSV